MPGTRTFFANSSTDAPTTTQLMRQRGSNIAPESKPRRTRSCPDAGERVPNATECFRAPRMCCRHSMGRKHSNVNPLRADGSLVPVDGVHDVDVAGRLLGNVAGDRA